MKILSLLFSLSILSFSAPGFAQSEKPLTAQAQLIPFEVEPGQVATLEIKVQLPPGYKAYKDKFKVSVVEDLGFKVSQLSIEPAHEIDDRFTKQKKWVIQNSATLTAALQIPEKPPTQEEIQLQIGYQACTETYCLFPETLAIRLSFKMRDSLSPSSSDGFLSLSFDQVYKKGLFLTFLFVFVMGLATSLTPCVYPMIPITIAILGREAHARTRWQTFLVSFVYVSGIGLTFSALGVFAASTGILFGSLMSSPWVVGFMAAVFLAMSLSMFGLYEIQAPQFLRDGVLSHSNLHGYSGALISGMLSGIVASPCVGPVLVGILTFVAQTKNLWLGFWLLFFYAFGMGVLFLALGLSTTLTKHLPKSGHWMTTVKIVFGVLLLGASFYYFKLLGSSLNWWESPAQITQSSPDKQLNGIQWVAYSEEILRTAAKEKKPVLIDMRADWCAACLEMEEITFVDQAVVELAKQFVMVRFDATQDSPELQKLKKEFSVYGLPTFLFFDAQGRWLQELTLTAFENPKDFHERMRQSAR